ncbi:serine/threonine protein kinase, partial [Tieghemiomyces parasiticus]
SLHKRGETVTSVSKDVWGVLLSLSPKYPTRQLTKRDRHAEDKCGYMLGRHRECDLRLNHPQISNRHCLIYAVHVDGVETVFIKDLSTNGTYVNGAKLPRQEPRQLGDGDTIKLTGYSEGGALQDQDTDETFIFQHVTARRRDAQAATGAATGDDGPAPPRYSSFQSNYLILRPLGRGSFADVHMAANRLTGQQFAVKVIDKKKFQLAPRVIATAREEFNILISMHHPAVIAIHGVYDEADSLYMILEYARDGELFDEIVARNGFTESETRTIFFQLFTAIKYLHDRGVVHRDLKPENILLADRSTLTIKLTDFGLAKVVRDENTFMKTLCGTPNYVAPEVLVPGHERAYSRAVDMWSLGVILYICLCGFPPFSEDFAPPAMQFQIKEAIYSFPPPIWDRISGDAVDLVTRLLQKDPERRLTVEEALVHPWMRTTFDGVTYALDNGPTEVVDTTEAYAMEPQTQREAEPNGNGQNALNGPRDPVMFSPFRVPPGLITSSDVISSPAGPPGQGSDAAKNLLGQAKRKRDQSGSSFSSSASSSSSLFLGKPRKHPAIYPNQPLEPQSSNLFASSRYPDVPFQPHENDSQDCGPAGFAATTTTTTTLGQDLLDHGFSHADDSRPTVSLTVDRDDSFDPAVYFGRGSSSILMNHEIGGDGDDTAGLALPQLGRDLSSPLGRPELTVGQRQDHEDSAMQISRTNSPSSSLPKTPPTSGG